jgi:uncharacterized protein involved in type VI secretion and phage assembly
MSITTGVVVGKVERWPRPDEAANMGEVVVSLPVSNGDEDFRTARLAMPMAGADTGFFVMPEPGDEVLVAFQNGDTNHPYIVGCVWNGKHAPPGAKYEHRTFKSKARHTIELNDEAGQERVLITTGGGRKVEIKDSPTASISIECKGGNTIVIDEATGAITISAATSVKVDAPKVDVNATQATIAAKQLTIDSLQATISAKQLLIDSLATVFTGAVVVQQGIVTQAMVSQAYNPLVPGNIFGL